MTLPRKLTQQQRALLGALALKPPRSPITLGGPKWSHPQ